MSSEYAKQLGAKLRAIRTQQGLSLHGVEEKSQGRWKAVVVGSYERGDRAVTVQRLAELADFYGVPISDLPPDAPAAAAATELPPPPGRSGRRRGHRAATPARPRPREAAADPGRPRRSPVPLHGDDPEPARRLQRPGALHPARGPAVTRRDLRRDAQPAHRAADRLGRAQRRGAARHRTARLSVRRPICGSASPVWRIYRPSHSP